MYILSGATATTLVILLIITNGYCGAIRTLAINMNGC